MTTELRIVVVGAGVMGTDHIARITRKIAGATVSAIVEPDAGRAAAAAGLVPGVAMFPRIEDALEAGAVDAALIAAPAQFHEPVLLSVLRAGLPILCEKPLTPDPESAWRILEAEQEGGRQLIQVGFMRRFDPHYRQLRAIISAGTAGKLLMLHAAHRNPSVPSGYTQDMLITDSVVHEFDIIPWLARSSIHTVEVRYGRRNSLGPAHLRQPVLVLMELESGVLADVEMSASARFGYQVATEAVLESGVARIGQPAGLQLWHDERFQIAEHASYTSRFSEAYDAEVQAWADAARRGAIAGPSAWDAYAAAVACATGVQALSAPGPVSLDLPAVPDFYAGTSPAIA